MRFFDTHAHLNDDSFSSILPAVLERARLSGLRNIILIGTTLATSKECVALKSIDPMLHAAVGIQPNYVHEAAPGDWQEIVNLARSGEALALGETGLDKYWHDAPFELQQDYFDRHLRLSQELGLPFIVHMRECGAEVLAMLQQAAARGPLRGVMHSFTGDIALAEACLDLGLFISFAGMVTYKKSDELRRVAAMIPADRLLIETDSPYLSPQAVRAQRPNEPAHVIHTAACLAEVRGVGLATIAEQTWKNACELFRLPSSS